MCDIRISSWNMQGGANADFDGRVKIQYLEPYLSISDKNIILLQEEGSPGGTGFAKDEHVIIGGIEFVCVLAKEDPVAINERCTTAILVDKRLIDLGHFAGADVEYSGVYRPLCYVDLDCNLRIATIHAIAAECEAISEVKSCLNWLDNNLAKNEHWILMGDFNSGPWCYPVYSYKKTKEELLSNCIQTISYKKRSNCKIYFDDCPTQGAGGERYSYLDYVFFSERFGFWTGGINNTKVLKCRKKDCDVDCIGCSYYDENKNTHYVSDHNLIQLKVYV